MNKGKWENHQVKKEMVEEIREYQSSQRSISPDRLPFDLTAELGTVIEAEEISHGVYSIAIAADKKDWMSEYYVVTENAPAISDEARSYGQGFDGKPGLRVYDLLRPGSGRRIIEFEIARYQVKHHLPIVEHSDSSYATALYGMEEHPDYFGEYPVPAVTPRGYTVRHKKIINGVYWLETDRCEEMLSVCYPIWQADITIPEQNLAEQLEYDRVQGIDITLGNLFFPKQSSCIPLFELSLSNPEIAANGTVNIPALLNAICASYPEYTAAYNNEQMRYKRDALIHDTPDAGTEFISL